MYYGERVFSNKVLGQIVAMMIDTFIIEYDYEIAEIYYKRLGLFEIDSTRKKKLSEAINALKDKIESAKILVLKSVTDRSCCGRDTAKHTRVPLLKKSFSIEPLEGKVHNFEMICDKNLWGKGSDSLKKMLFAEIDSTIEYIIPEKIKYCSIYVYGDPGAKFQILYQ